MTTTFGGVQRWVDQNGLLVKTWLPLLEHTPFHALEQKLPTIGPDMGDYERQMYWTGMRSPLWTPRAANGYARSARCNYFHDHVAPKWDCTCGFYALTDKPDYPEYGRFIARVELFGTVIEAQHGYRASRQRVLSLEVFRECQAEDRVGDHCDREADGFQVTKGGNVWPVCATHAPLGYTELADLRAKLGTEVKWVAA